MSKELLASKVVVFEEEPQVRGISSASTSVAGAVGVTEKGPVDTPILCTSFAAFQDVFGGFTATSDLALGAKGFFENGGSQLWVVRVAPPGSQYAGGVLTDGVFGNVAGVGALGPGEYWNRVAVELGPMPNDATLAYFAVTVDDAEVERFENLALDPLSPRFIEKVVDDPDVGSKLVYVSYLLGGTPSTISVISTLLGGGSDGTAVTDLEIVGSDADGTGIYALNNVQDLSLLFVPGQATPAVHAAMVQYCEVTRDGTVFAIMDPPAGLSAEAMLEYATVTAGLEGLSEYAAIYWPRVKVLNPKRSVFGDTDQIVVAPSGIIAGVYARTDGASPGGVYVQPAGIEAGRTFGVVGFETNDTLKERKRDLLYPHRINLLTTKPGLPKYIDGARTLLGGGNFPSIAERRGVVFIERSLKQGLQFARHENNTPELRAQIRRTIIGFLLTQMRNGAFASQDPTKAFFVDVSDQLNTPSVIAEGKILVRVGLATNKPAEYVVLMISQDTRALDEELAAAG